MTLGDIIKVISDRLGDRTGLDDRIIRELNFAQTELERSGDDLPWFLEESGTSLNVPTAQSVALPTGFLRMISVFATTTEYCKGDRSDLRLEGAKGRKIYAISKSTLFLPDGDSSAVALTVDFYKADTVLSKQTDTNGWTTDAPGMLIGNAGMQIGAFLRDAEAVQLFAIQLARSEKKMKEEIVAREELGARREMNKSA